MKNGIFVDVTNLYFGVIKKFGKKRKLDYKKYLDFVAGDDDLYKAIAYGSQMGDEANKFISRIEEDGFETQYKQHEDKPLSPNVEIAWDARDVIEYVDTVILGSNDPNIEPLVHKLKDQGIRVIVFAASIPDNLKAAASYALEIPSSILE